MSSEHTLSGFAIEHAIPLEEYNWYTDEGLTERVDPDTFIVIGDNTLYTVKKVNDTPHGTLSNGLKWSVSGDTLTLSPSDQGEGNIICDFRKPIYPWNTYTASIKKVILNNGITST